MVRFDAEIEKIVTQAKFRIKCWKISHYFSSEIGTSLPESADLRNRPHKSLNNDFRTEISKNSGGHFDGLSKFYKLSYVGPRSIHWVRNSQNT